MKTYRFIKLEDYWFIDLPEYIEQGGNPGDLQMVDGADTMLDVMAENGDSVSLTISILGAIYGAACEDMAAKKRTSFWISPFEK